MRLHWLAISTIIGMALAGLLVLKVGPELINKRIDAKCKKNPTEFCERRLK